MSDFRQYALTAAHAIFQSQNEGAAKAKEILDTVMDIFIKSMVEDDDKEVVAQACTNVADIIRDYGYATLEPYLPELVHATLLLLQEKSACQQIESDSEIDDENSAHDEVQLLSHEKSACQQIESDSEIDDENSAHDEVLMDGVSDLLPAFAKAMGAQFVSIFAQLFDPLMKFAKAFLYVDRVMPLVLKEIVSSEATNRRNAAFCVGELCKNGGDSALKYYDNILRGLHPLFGESEPDDAVRDNAAGAVASMIMVLPVFLRVLPLKEDREESLAVYSCVSALVFSSNPQWRHHLSRLLKSKL
ncbi:hypothetical protein P8452_15124 [Trifolium repens]|nr:hypothetical protein P8452_15124 [Trifolium repens]